MWKSYSVENYINISHIHSVFEAKREVGYSFQGEYHNFWECVYILDGCICTSGDERVYYLSQGDIIFHKPMELHKYYVDGDKPASIFVFSFSVEGKTLDFFKDKVFHLSGASESIMHGLVDYVRRKSREHNTNSYYLLFENIGFFSHMMTTYIIQLLLSLYDEYDDKEKVLPLSHSPEAQIFENAVVFMSKNVETVLSVSDIAHHCNISETKLKSVFNKFSSMGVHKYFLQLKLRAATELLKNGSSVTETAEKLGFSSQGYFTTVCKRELGLCPSDIK